MKNNIRFWAVTAGIIAVCASFIYKIPCVSALQVALVMTGTINDGGFCTQGYQALQLLKEKYGAKMAYTELVKLPDAERVMRRYASTGFDIIMGHAGELKQTVIKVAPDYPKACFTMVHAGSHFENQPKNVWVIEGYYHQAYYLAGIAAGLATKTNKIGYVGGIDFPVYISACKAFEIGAKAINPNAQVFVTFLGTFDDALKAREAAKAQIEQGVDIIGHSTNLAVFGIIEVIKGTDARMIGMGIDQNILAPGKVITTVFIDQELIFETVTKNVMKGELGGNVENSFKAGFSRLTPFYGHLTPEQEAIIEQTGKDIKSGKLEVPLIYKR